MEPIETFKNLPPEQQQEIIKQGIKAVDKLSNGVGKVLGYFFEAKHLKQMADAEAYKIKTLADAKAYEINTLGDAVRNNKDLPVDFHNEDSSLILDITDGKQLVERSNLRLQYQQAKKEQNIESVIGKAVLELGDKTTDSTEDVDEDWYTRFFNIVEDISDEQLQSLWARILAGEILKPKSYSLRVLEFLKNISKDELDLILEITPFITEKLIFHQDNLLEKYDISYDLILRLDELGIVNSSGFIEHTMKLEPKTNGTFFQTNNLICFIENKTDNKINIETPIFSVNEIGIKLYELSNKMPNLDFLKEVLTSISKEYRGIRISLYEIIYRDEKIINYKDYPIFEISENRNL